jgi:hypothetical protein
MPDRGRHLEPVIKPAHKHLFVGSDILKSDAKHIQPLASNQEEGFLGNLPSVWPTSLKGQGSSVLQAHQCFAI